MSRSTLAWLEIALALVTRNLTRIGWMKKEQAGLKPCFRYGAFGEMAKGRAGLARTAVRPARERGWIHSQTPVALTGDAPRISCCAGQSPVIESQEMRMLLLTLLAALGAFAQKTTVEFDEAADFSKYKTFAIRDGRLTSANPALNSELVKKHIEADIERALAAKGLALVSGRSDLNVRYHFGAARRTQLESYPAGWRGLGRRVVRVPYAEGTLVIDMRDPTTRSLVWRGIASEAKSDARQIEGKLDDMVRKALDKYPPKRK